MKIGRKGKYHEWLTEDGLTKLQGWARDGLTEEQIAENMGIVRTTLYTWKNRYPELDKALKKGKEVIDRHVENALLKRALGYSYEEVTYERVYDADTDSHVRVETKRVTKEVHPDVTAQIFWLKNRKPEEWRDRRETAISGNMSINNPYAELTTEELKKLIKQG